MSEKAAPKTRIRPAQSAPSLEAQSSALYKLIFFALLIVIAPLGTYYASLEYYFGPQNTIYAAVSAAVVVNVVLVAYIVVAFLEDTTPASTRPKQS